MIQRLARRYVGYFNSRYARTGTLWEGRFHSSVIATDFYLLACHRYIENNPVRAGMVAHPAMYLWSSHLHNACGKADPLVTPHPTILALGRNEEARRQAYNAMFTSPASVVETDAFRAALRLSRPIGFPETPRRKPGRPAKEIGL